MCIYLCRVLGAAKMLRDLITRIQYDIRTDNIANKRNAGKWVGKGVTQHSKRDAAAAAVGVKNKQFDYV